MIFLFGRFGLMDTQVVRKERKKSRRVQDDTTAEEAQPTEYTNKVGELALNAACWLNVLL